MKFDLSSLKKKLLILKEEQMKIFCELAEAITERFAQEMENLQDVFASYLHSNLRTFLNNSDVLHEAKMCYQNLKENEKETSQELETEEQPTKTVRDLLVKEVKVHQTSLGNPQLFLQSDGLQHLKGNQLYKLLQKKSIDFLSLNAERALRNLTQFSFSDLEIVSKSGQTVCAKLADKMRNKMLDEELQDVKVSLQASLTPKKEEEGLSSKEALSEVLMEMLKTRTCESEEGVPFRKGKGYLRPEEVRLLQQKGDSQVHFGIQKELLKVLFPEGFNVKDIELNGGEVELEKNADISRISEQSEEKENYISGNLQVRGGEGGLTQRQNGILLECAQLDFRLFCLST